MESPTSTDTRHDDGTSGASRPQATDIGPGCAAVIGAPWAGRWWWEVLGDRRGDLEDAADGSRGRARCDIDHPAGTQMRVIGHHNNPDGLIRSTRRPANDSRTVQSAPNHLDRPHFEPCSRTKPLPDDSAPSEDNPAIRSARQTLITAITRRITQQRLTAAQAAAVLHLTGPKVTQATPSQHRRIHTR